MKPCKVYSIQENDVIVPERDYYEVEVFNSYQPYVISDTGKEPLLIEKEVQHTPIRKFSEISEFGTRINTYVAFDKKLEDYVNTITEEQLHEQEFSHNKEISMYKEDLDKALFELKHLREHNYHQRREFMVKRDNLLFKLSLASTSYIGVMVFLLSKYYF